jgi:flagellar motor switch protein FliG
MTAAPEKDKKDEEKLSGRRKAAAFLLSLDSETAAMIMQQLSEREVSLLSQEMSELGELSGKDAGQALSAFQGQSGGDTQSVEPMVNALLERALGRDKAKSLLDKIHNVSPSTEPFACLHHLEAKQIATIIKEEHPQVQALVLSHLKSDVSSKIIKDMDEEARFEVVKRMASSEDLPPTLVRQVDEMIETRAFAMGKPPDEASANNRFKTVAQMLNTTDPAMSKAIIERLTRESPAAANEIQALMFVFEDLLKIGDRDMQKVLTEIDKADLALALKAAPQEIADKLLNNLSTRARENIKEEIEMLGPRPLSEVEEAQKRILGQVRQMEERGDIQVRRGGGEVMV